MDSKDVSCLLDVFKVVCLFSVPIPNKRQTDSYIGMKMDLLPLSFVFLFAMIFQLSTCQSVGNGPVSIGQPMAPLDPNHIQPGYFVPLQHDYMAQPVTGFNNTATCTFDPQCFQYSEGCTFLDCRPYNRSAPVTCEECLNLCLSQQSTQGPYCCKAIVYDVQYRICDLFSQNIGGNMANLAKRPGHIYFQPTGMCQAIAATTPAPAAICPSGQSEKLVAIKDYQLPGMTGQTSNGVASATDCAHACQSNTLADGTPFACKSAQFVNNQCTLSNAQPVAEGSVQPAPGTTYYQKLCFPTSSVAGCADIFEEDPQRLLVGQSRQVADASSVPACLQACLDSQAKFGFACASTVFFPNVPTQNCILNSETKLTKPDVFTNADDSTKAFYLETGCGAGAGGGTITRFRDQSIVSKSRSTGTLWARTSNRAATPVKSGDLWGRIKRELAADDVKIRVAKNRPPQAWN